MYLLSYSLLLSCFRANPLHSPKRVDVSSFVDGAEPRFIQLLSTLTCSRRFAPRLCKKPWRGIPSSSRDMLRRNYKNFGTWSLSLKHSSETTLLAIVRPLRKTTPEYGILHKNGINTTRKLTCGVLAPCCCCCCCACCCCLLLLAFRLRRIISHGNY